MRKRAQQRSLHAKKTKGRKERHQEGYERLRGNSKGQNEWHSLWVRKGTKERNWQQEAEGKDTWERHPEWLCKETWPSIEAELAGTI